MRRDAEHNRLRILRAAHTAFAADGLDVAMREIARLAGVAPATVYRHFATRAALTHAVLDEHVAACAAELDRRLADPDPGRALRATIESFAQRTLSDRGLNEALLGPGAARGPFEAQRRAHSRAFEKLVDRARATGSIRADVTVADLRACLVAISGLGALPRASAPMVVERVVNLILDGMVSRAGDTPADAGLPHPRTRSRINSARAAGASSGIQ